MVFTFSQARAEAHESTQALPKAPCGSHSGDESLPLSVRGSGSGLSHGCGVVLLPLSGGGSGGLLLVNGEVGGVAQYGRQDGGG
jgi:hypothetical protein